MNRLTPVLWGFFSLSLIDITVREKGLFKVLLLFKLTYGQFLLEWEQCLNLVQDKSREI